MEKGKLKLNKAIQWLLTVSAVVILNACSYTTEQPRSKPGPPTDFQLRKIVINGYKNETLQINPTDTLKLPFQHTVNIAQPIDGNALILFDSAANNWQIICRNGATGLDSAEYTVCAGSLCKKAFIVFRITDTTNPATCELYARAIPTQELIQDDTIDSELGNYIDACPGTVYTIEQDPANGRLTIELINGKLKARYLPRRGYYGLDLFALRATNPTNGRFVILRFPIRVRVRQLNCNDLFSVQRKANIDYRVPYPLHQTILRFGFGGWPYDRLIGKTSCQSAIYEIDWLRTEVIDSTKHGKLIPKRFPTHFSPNYVPDNGFYGLDSFQVRVTTFGMPPNVPGLQRSLYIHINVRRP